jgi:hypothetical protein
MMRVRVTLDGAADNVLGVIGLALESGILDQMDTVSRLETDDLPELPRVRGSAAQRGVPMRSGVGLKRFKHRSQYAKPFENAGTRVVIQTFHGRHADMAREGHQLGDVGTVVSHKLKGNGVKVEVKWDRTGETSWINGSYLKVVQKVPLANRS